MSPALGEEVNKDPGHACVRGARGSQSLAWPRLQNPCNPSLLTSPSFNCGLPVTKKNYKKYSLYFSLPFSWLQKKKSKTVIFWNKTRSEERAACGLGHSGLMKPSTSPQIRFMVSLSYPPKLKAEPGKGSEERPGGTRITHMLLESPEQSVHMISIQGLRHLPHGPATA